jgi:hypothetical protein
VALAALDTSIDAVATALFERSSEANPVHTHVGR